MKNDLDLYNYDQNKYVKDVNYLIKYYNYILLMLKNNTNGFEKLKFYKQQPVHNLYIKIITIPYSLLKKLKSIVIDITQKFNLLLYEKNYITHEKQLKYNNEVLECINDRHELFLYSIKLSKYINGLISVQSEDTSESFNEDTYNKYFN